MVGCKRGKGIIPCLQYMDLCAFVLSSQLSDCVHGPNHSVYSSCQFQKHSEYLSIMLLLWSKTAFYFSCFFLQKHLMVAHFSSENSSDLKCVQDVFLVLFFSLAKLLSENLTELVYADSAYDLKYLILLENSII